MAAPLLLDLLPGPQVPTIVAEIAAGILMLGVLERDPEPG